MTNAQVEVITLVQRRRRWSRSEKERLVAASLEPHANASAVARGAGIHVSQLFRWRKELCGSGAASCGFVPVQIAAQPVPASGGARGGSIEIEYASGTRLRIIGAVDAGVLAATLAALGERERRR